MLGGVDSKLRRTEASLRQKPKKNACQKPIRIAAAHGADSDEARGKIIDKHASTTREPFSSPDSSVT